MSLYSKHGRCIQSRTKPLPNIAWRTSCLHRSNYVVTVSKVRVGKTESRIRIMSFPLSLSLSFSLFSYCFGLTSLYVVVDTQFSAIESHVSNFSLYFVRRAISSRYTLVSVITMCKWKAENLVCSSSEHARSVARCGSNENSDWFSVGVKKLELVRKRRHGATQANALLLLLARMSSPQNAHVRRYTYKCNFPHEQIYGEEKTSANESKTSNRMAFPLQSFRCPLLMFQFVPKSFCCHFVCVAFDPRRPCRHVISSLCYCFIVWSLAKQKALVLFFLRHSHRFDGALFFSSSKAVINHSKRAEIHRKAQL